MKDLFSFDERPRKREVYVLDTETTGLHGAPKDVVVDIGICLVDLDEGSVTEAYSAVVGHDVDAWDDYRKNAWIFENTDMTLDMVRKGKPFPEVREEVLSVIGGGRVTSYNTGYDFGRFLFKEPWNLCGAFRECRDIMLAAAEVCKLKPFYYNDGYRWPRLDVAYRTILGDEDPAGIHGVQDHRALSDARMASHIMIAMHDAGLYPFARDQRPR
ncbi:MAG: 3'-5' exonuclease [Euryarchaeota archaeon]|nr:3'-5' exonuclease [Euryarchaeota archaeon]